MAKIEKDTNVWRLVDDESGSVEFAFEDVISRIEIFDKNKAYCYFIPLEMSQLKSLIIFLQKQL